jgi:tetratricopeptide (TPR) repeat protein
VPIREHTDSRFDFQERLEEIGHFPTPYEHADALTGHFTTQLEDLCDDHTAPVANNDIPRDLTPPPFLPEVFIGREEDLQRIHDRLFGPGGNLLLLVNGEGGMGKTSLASRYYHTYQHEYAHTGWVLSEHSIAGALLQLAPRLGLQFDPAAETRERLDILLSAMAGLPKPCLLVVDNANELADLEANYLYLRKCSNFHLLLTTRITAFEQADCCPVGGLPEAEALALFEKHYRTLDTDERTLFARIRTAVGENTLVLELLAKNLAVQNRLRPRYALSDLLADLQGRGLLGLTQSSLVGTAYQSKDTLRREAPEAIIAAMYDMGGLSPEETALLSAFAALPAESIPFAVLDTLLGGQDQDMRLIALAQKGWIEYNEPEAAFKCSPVVQEVLRLKNPALQTDCAPLVKNLVKELHPDTIHEENYRHSTLYARLAEGVVAILKKTDDDVAILCQNLGNFYTVAGDLRKALQAYQQMADLQAALLAVEPVNVHFKNGLAISCEKLGDTYSAVGNLEQALMYYEKGLELSKELYEVHPNNVVFKNGLAISYSKLGDTYSAVGNLEQALMYYEKGLELSKELYEVHPNKVDFKNGLAISYSRLGDTYSAVGNLEQALMYYEKALELSKELYEFHPNNVALKNGLAISCSNLGDTYSALGGLEQALMYYETYLELTNELYEFYPNNVNFKEGLAICFSRLGNTFCAMGNLERALIYYQEQTTLFKELYESYPNNVSFKNGLAISYARLGQFSRDELQDSDQPKQYFRQAEQLWVELVAAAPQYVHFQRSLEWVRQQLED